MTLFGFKKNGQHSAKKQRVEQGGAKSATAGEAPTVKKPAKADYPTEAHFPAKADLEDIPVKADYSTERYTPVSEDVPPDLPTQATYVPPQKSLASKEGNGLPKGSGPSKANGLPKGSGLPKAMVPSEGLGEPVERPLGTGEKKKKKKRGTLLLDVLIVVFAAAFLFSAYKLISYYVSSEDEKSDLQSLADRVEQAEESTEVTSTVSDGTAPSTTPKSIYGASGMLLKYEALYQENNDLAGWLKIDGTEINYPVMYTPDNMEYYLRRNWQGDYAYSGLPFIDTNCDPFTPTTNQIIYGHNMKNGTMFSDLLDYADESFFKEHSLIEYDSMYELRQYKVLAAFYTEILAEDEEGFRYYSFFNAANEDEFNNFYDNVKDLSLYDTGVEASFGDQLITLSTCSYHVSNGRFVVVAVKVNNTAN